MGVIKEREKVAKRGWREWLYIYGEEMGGLAAHGFRGINGH